MKDFIESISKVLQSTSYTIEREPFVGGVRPDFVVHGPGGQVIVVEGKVWDKNKARTDRAARLAQRYRGITGASNSIVVLDGLNRDYPGKGVVSIKGLPKVLDRYFEESAGQPPPVLETKKVNQRTVFAAMPFEEKYDDTFLVAMTYAAMMCRVACVRMDRYEYVGDVVVEIKRQIDESCAVIVDLSESKPNVMFELGYAHGRNKPIVPISSSSLNELPFDVRNWNVIKYSLGQTVALRKPLSKRLKAALR